jgi:hypothetical protein
MERVPRELRSNEFVRNKKRKHRTVLIKVDLLLSAYLTTFSQLNRPWVM